MSEWGPLAALIGEWEGAGGLDTAHSAATGEVLRGFAVPRGISVLAGGTAAADATEWTMRAAQGDLKMREFDEDFAHVDHDSELRRVG